MVKVDILSVLTKQRNLAKIQGLNEGKSDDEMTSMRVHVWGKMYLQQVFFMSATLHASLRT